MNITVKSHIFPLPKCETEELDSNDYILDHSTI